MIDTRMMSVFDCCIITFLGACSIFLAFQFRLIIFGCLFFYVLSEFDGV